MRSILIFFLLIATQLSAQQWPLESSRWIYPYTLVGGLTGSYELMMGPDTMLDGQIGQVMLKNQTYNWPQPDNTTIFTQSGFTPFRILHSSGDSVFYHQAGQWMLLYDFGSEVGDTWYCHIVIEEGVCPDDTTTVQVAETGTVDVNGTIRRYLELETISNSDFNLTGLAVEGIGMVSSAYTYALFPGVGILDQCGIIVESELSDFSCYFDAEIGVYGEGDCAFVSLEEEQITSLTISPNPVQNWLRIELSSPFSREYQVEVHDLMGRGFVCPLLVNNSGRNLDLDTSKLIDGTYVLQLQTQSKVLTKVFVKGG